MNVSRLNLFRERLLAGLPVARVANPLPVRPLRL
jgi:hypothetical protein